MSVDGTDCQIEEPWPFQKEFSKMWYSHKFKGAGVRYELGVAIYSGDIVWINGPYECSVNDLTIFRDALMFYLDKDERVEADKGYRGVDPEFAKTPAGLTRGKEKKLQSTVRSRHETVNKRLKQFGILSGVYRHDLFNHNFVFRAVAVITQLVFESGQPVFSVEYKD